MFELIVVTSVLVLAFVVERVATRNSTKKARRGRIAVGAEGVGFIGADEPDQDIENIFVVDDDDMPETAPATLRQQTGAKPRLKLRLNQVL